MDSDLERALRARATPGERDLSRLPSRVLHTSASQRRQHLALPDLADYANVLVADEDEWVRFLEEIAAALGDESRRTRIRVVEASEREQRFRQLAENLRDVVWLTEWSTNQVLYVNPAYERVWGVPAATLYQDARSWAHPIHPDDKERVVAEFVAGAETGSYDTEYRILRGDDVVWIHDRAFPIYDDEGNVYRVAGISEDVTPKKLVEQALRQSRDELEERVAERTRTLQEAYAALQRVTSEALLAEDRERRSLAVDLHDGLGQLISLIGMKLSAHRAGVPDEDGALREISSLVEQANRMARSLTFQLSPPVLYDLGLEPALQWLCEDMQTNYGLAVDFTDDEAEKPLELRMRLGLFRAVRELLINVVKHADVDRASVSISRAADSFQVVVSDAGYGFEGKTLAAGQGHGLFAIRERIRHLGGDVEIDSTPGEGTRVALTAPVDADSRTQR